MADAQAIHVWHRCHNCGAEPIVGPRYDCRTCRAGPDNHLCEVCYAAYTRGAAAHPAPDSLEAVSSTARTVRHEFAEVAGRPREQFDGWSKVAEQPDRERVVTNRFIVRPEFCTRGTSFLGSYAFVVEPGPACPALVLTALHVMDELVRAVHVDCSPGNTSYTGTELPRAVEHVNLYDIFASNWMQALVGVARPMLALPHARFGDEEPHCQRDIAAFTVDPSARLTPARLAARAPAVGDPIWLAVNLGRGQIRRTMTAVVVERTASAMIFRFASGRDIPRYSSGAPLVNECGDVVGINVGRGCLDGRRYGHAVHVDSICAHLGLAGDTVRQSLALQ